MEWWLGLCAKGAVFYRGFYRRARVRMLFGIGVHGCGVRLVDRRIGERLGQFTNENEKQTQTDRQTDTLRYLGKPTSGYTT